MSIEPNPEKVLVTDSDMWVNEAALQHAYGLLLESYGYKANLEVGIVIGDDQKRIDIYATGDCDQDFDTLLIEAKQVLTTGNAFQIVGQLQTYSRVCNADRLIALVGRVADSGAISTLKKNDVELIVYSPNRDRLDRLDFSNEPQSEPVYSSGSSYSSIYDFDLDWMPYVIGAFILLACIGAVVGAGTYNPADPAAIPREALAPQPNGIKRGDRIRIVRTVNVRSAPSDQHKLLGTLNAGGLVTAVRDETVSGWIEIKDDSNFTGWVFYEYVQVEK